MEKTKKIDSGGAGDGIRADGERIGAGMPTEGRRTGGGDGGCGPDWLHSVELIKDYLYTVFFVVLFMSVKFILHRC